MVRETIVELELPLGPSSDSLTIESLQKKRKGSKTCASKRGFTEDNSSQSHKRKKDRVAAARKRPFFLLIRI